MARYITEERVPVSDGADTIYIRSKMNFEQRERAEDAVRTITATADGPQAEVKAGAYRIALLRINVVGWEGPGFEGLKFTQENINKLDPDDPLVEKVMEQIAQRNPPSWKVREEEGDGADPLAEVGNDGSARSVESSQESESENGTYTSYSPNGTIGLQLLPQGATPTS